jgi:hypothetical protein
MSKPKTYEAFIGLALLVLMLAFGIGELSNAPPVQAQGFGYTPGVHTLQVTIGASTTQVSTTSIPIKQLFIQNNAAHTIRVGDSNTTSSRGALISSGSPGGSITSGSFGIQQATDLQQWFINGTNGDVIDVIYVQ